MCSLIRDESFLHNGPIVTCKRIGQWAKSCKRKFHLECRESVKTHEMAKWTFGHLSVRWIPGVPYLRNLTSTPLVNRWKRKQERYAGSRSTWEQWSRYEWLNSKVLQGRMVAELLSSIWFLSRWCNTWTGSSKEARLSLRYKLDEHSKIPR